MRWQGSGDEHTTRSFMLCTPHQISFGWSNQEEWDGWDIWHVLGTGEVHTGFGWKYFMEGYQLEDLGLNGRVILKLMFKKWNLKARTESLWLRIRRDNEVLRYGRQVIWTRIRLSEHSTAHHHHHQNKQICRRNWHFISQYNHDLWTFKASAFLSVSFLLHNNRNLPHINHQLCTSMDAACSPTGQNKSIVC